MAYNFQGLQLEDDGAVSTVKFQQPDLTVRDEGDAMRENESAVRKRTKLFGGLEKDNGISGRVMSDGSREVPETPDKRAFSVVIGAQSTLPPLVAAEKVGTTTLHNEVDPMIFKGSPVGKVKAGNGLARAYPSINRLSDSKSRAPKPKKRSGTPPLLGSVESGLEVEDRVVDEERAALTWHDDEITGHNPTDPDDDGEGINGIGFKPTPAMAYARTEKRRQQIQEYKNREAREARAKRSERRRVNEVSKTSREEEEAARTVRFMEASKENVISTS